jgi:hypothetical protein
MRGKAVARLDAALKELIRTRGIKVGDYNRQAHLLPAGTGVVKLLQNQSRFELTGPWVEDRGGTKLVIYRHDDHPRLQLERGGKIQKIHRPLVIALTISINKELKKKRKKSHKSR